MNPVAVSALILGALIISSLVVAVGLLVWQESKPLREKLKGMKTNVHNDDEHENEEDGQDREGR